MDPQRFRQVDRVVAAVSEGPRAQRQRTLTEFCGSDADLLREVEALLRADDECRDFLSQPLDGDAVARALDGLDPCRQEVAGPDGAGADRLGSYRLLEVLGQGGAAVVYRARADGDGQEVAVKVSRQGWKRAYARRFEAEREILARLGHPGIARFLDGGTTADGRLYLVMEYVDGVPVDRHCDDGRLGIGERLEILSAVCSAVAYAHDRGVIHRDLKPQNILVARAGQTAPDRVKLLDFGIAKLLAPERFAVDLSETGSGHCPLTPGYASPEQVGGSEVTPASDVYSLGVVLFELLTGCSPYRFAHPWPLPLEIVEAVCERPPWTMGERLDSLAEDPALAEEVCRARAAEALGELRQQLAPLERVVARALEKDPQRRFRSAPDLAWVLRGCRSARRIVSIDESPG